MNSAKVNSWMETLLTGTPRPLQLGWPAFAGFAGAAAAKPRHSTAAAAMAINPAHGPRRFLNACMNALLLLIRGGHPSRPRSRGRNLPDFDRDASRSLKQDRGLWCVDQLKSPRDAPVRLRLERSLAAPDRGRARAAARRGLRRCRPHARPRALRPVRAPAAR